jgi:hypothetical protein
MTTLDCKRCGESKTLDQYGTFRNGTRKEGKRKICNFCRAQRAKELRAADPEKYRAIDNASYQRNKEYQKQYGRNYHLKKKYGMTAEQWDATFESQGCACAICKSRETSHHWCVDHDHESGEVRGILCSPCNILIGMAKDHPQVLDDAKRYLEERGYYGRYQPSLL